MGSVASALQDADEAEGSDDDGAQAQVLQEDEGLDVSIDLEDSEDETIQKTINLENLTENSGTYARPTSTLASTLIKTTASRMALSLTSRSMLASNLATTTRSRSTRTASMAYKDICQPSSVFAILDGTYEVEGNGSVDDDIDIEDGLGFNDGFNANFQSNIQLSEDVGGEISLQVSRDCTKDLVKNHSIIHLED